MPGPHYLTWCVACEILVIADKVSLVVITTFVGNFSKGKCRISFQMIK